MVGKSHRIFTGVSEGKKKNNMEDVVPRDMVRDF